MTDNQNDTITMEYSVTGEMSGIYSSHLLSLIGKAQAIGFTMDQQKDSEIKVCSIQELNEFIKLNFSSYFHISSSAEIEYVDNLMTFLINHGADLNNIKDLEFIFKLSNNVISLLLEHGLAENKLFGSYVDSWSHNNTQMNTLVNEWFERKFLEKLPEFNLADGSKYLIDPDGKLLSSRLISEGDYNSADKLLSLFPFIKNKFSSEEREKMFIFYAEEGRDLNAIKFVIDFPKQTLESLLSKGLSIDKIIPSHFLKLGGSSDNYSNKLEIIKLLNDWFEKNLLDKLPDFTLEGTSKLLIDEDGNTLLHKFVSTNRIDLAEKMLSLLPSMNNSFDNNKLSPLELAYSLNNSDAIMLFLEFEPINQVKENHCSAILDRFDNEYYVAKNLPSVEIYNMDSPLEAEKLFIFIMGPDTAELHDNAIFLKDALSSNIPTIVIGNGVELLSLNGIEAIINQYKPLPLNIELAILGHGELSKKSDDSSEIHHVIRLFNNRNAAETFDVFKSLANIFDDKPLNLTFISCNGGAALHHDIHALPEGSKVVAFAKHDNSVASDDTKSLVFPITSSNPSEVYMLDYLFGLQSTNNIPGIGYSGKGSKFIDEDANFIGKEINQCKKDKIIKTLDEVICKGDVLCLKNIEETIVKIENAPSIRDLMAPEEMSINAAKNKIPEKQDNEFQYFCEKSETEADFMSFIEIDAVFCEYAILNYQNEGFAECLDFKAKEEPSFGVAQAVLYLLGSLEFECA